MDLSPSDVFNLIDRYSDNEIEWFIERISKNYSIGKKLKKLELMNTLVIARTATNSKKGNAIYVKERRSLLADIEKLSIDESKLTVFERMKNKVNKGTSTIFTALKYLNKDK